VKNPNKKLVRLATQLTSPEERSVKKYLFSCATLHPALLLYINYLSHILNLIVRPTQQTVASFSLSNNKTPLPHNGTEPRIPPVRVSAMFCNSSSAVMSCLSVSTILLAVVLLHSIPNFLNNPPIPPPANQTHLHTTYCCPQNGAQFLYGGSTAKFIV